MSTTNYRQYVEQTLTLTKSLIVKNEATAVVMNTYIQALGHAISSDKTTWKYYLNLAGIPHFLDKPIYVSSFDTKETIEFSIESLKLHPVTKEYFQPHTVHFKSLVEKYPEQELLIRGILNPTPMAEAIDSEDYTILRFSKSLVEQQETNLIPNLQQRINNFSTRWNNPSYNVTDELYLASHLAVMYHNIPSWVMAIRLNNVKTNFAHSFHIKEYLKSHGRLDRYYNYLTIEQRFFLYRNILYLERNGGSQNSFEWLVDNILTKRGLGLAEYNLKNDVSEIKTTGTKVSTFVREGLNKHHNSNSKSEYTFSEVLEKERVLGRSNKDVEEHTVGDKSFGLVNNKRDKFKSKMLESSVLDLTEAGIIQLSRELIKYWLYMSCEGYYTASFKFINRKDSLSMDINARDGFILYLYLFNKALGITLTKIPRLTVTMVRSNVKVSRETLTNIGIAKYLDKETIDYLAEDEFKYREVPFNYTFAYTVKGLFDDFNRHHKFFSLKEHCVKRGVAQALTDRLYFTKDVDLVDTEMTYSDWLFNKGIDVEDLDVSEYEMMYSDLVKDMTGSKFISKITVSGIQEAMIDIMSQLSSYNIQYSRETNADPVIVWDKLDTRVGDLNGLLESSISLNNQDKIITDVYPKANIATDQSVCVDMEITSLYEDQQLVQLNPNPNVMIGERQVDHIRLPLPRTKIDVSEGA